VQPVNKIHTFVQIVERFFGFSVFINCSELGKKIILVKTYSDTAGI